MNHQDIVADQKSREPAETFATVEGMLGFVLRVIARLPAAENVGLVKAPPGAENVAHYAPANEFVRVNRVAYPDGRLIKILTDSGPGGGNGPAWNDDDTRPDLWLAVAPAGPVPAPSPAPPPPVVIDLTPRLAALEQLVAQQAAALDSRLVALENYRPAPAGALPALVAVGRVNVFGHEFNVRLPVKPA